MQGDSTTYMATELIDFLGTRRAGAKTLQENKGSMERTPYTFHQLMGESSPSTKNLQTSSVPRKSEEPWLFIKVKEENENLRHRVD